jgi:uncharacterized protein YodC (DUF2158 family)
MAMKANTFSPGDIVVLKSGGPRMTLDHRNAGSDETYYCKWFAGKKQEGGNFGVASLRLATDEDK